MANKYITANGKNKLLKLGFLHNNDTNNFNYIALGGTDSAGATGGQFQEIDGDNYSRQEVSLDAEGQQSITISAIFDENNVASSEGIEITEIGIVDHEFPAGNDEQFFAYAEVPRIVKTSNISLKYTIIISIE